MSQNARGQLRIHIEHLTVDAGVCAPGGVNALQDALAQELSRLMNGDQPATGRGDSQLRKTAARIAAELHRTLVRK